jgi:large subunit ribosomal protein L22
VAVAAPEQEVRAEAKWVRSSARKARLVVEHLRGLSVPEARTVLAFSTRAVARDVEKVLRSAVANAESNPNLNWNGDDLYVSTAYVDEGPTIKRFQMRARGRMGRINKRTCHITIKLAQRPGAVAAEQQKPTRRRRQTTQTEQVEQIEQIEQTEEATA